MPADHTLIILTFNHHPNSTHFQFDITLYSLFYQIRNYPIHHNFFLCTENGENQAPNGGKRGNAQQSRVKSLMKEPRAEWENQMCKCVKSGENRMTDAAANCRRQRACWSSWTCGCSGVFLFNILPCNILVNAIIPISGLL